MDLEGTEIIKTLEAKSESIKMLIWLGGSMVTGLTTGLVALWFKNQKCEEHAKELNSYIREQDKANLSLLADIAKNYEIMSIDVNKIEKMTSGEIKDILVSLKNKINILLKDHG